jgi:hypothetical protein
MEKTCSKCQAVFNCQNETRGCWCESMQLSAGTLKHLKENYENCLCRECLAGYEEVPATDSL